jgi:hypothetical protein
MAGKQRYSAAQVAKALQDNRGLHAIAAQRLGCSRQTILNYMTRYESVREACADARAFMVDLAESRLFDALMAQEAWAITFTLRTLGKERGYVPQLDTKDVSDHTGLADLLRVARATVEADSSNGASGFSSDNGHAPRR